MIAELPVRFPRSRRGRVVVKLRDDAYTLRLMRAAMGEHECRPILVWGGGAVPEPLHTVLCCDVPRETSQPSDTGSGAK